MSNLKFASQMCNKLRCNKLERLSLQACTLLKQLKELLEETLQTHVRYFSMTNTLAY